ncbi:hypothetical protein BGZ46_002442 [Entomortierella lignicola]|nr:hypothetical protein BGZ46_002442 [Entomortierella lignicola]
MAYTLSTSFTYAPDVVDFDAMNITETFPEASSFSFEMSGSYNHSYSDSISGIPLAQQALWDDGQLSMHHTINSSRVFGNSSGLSSLNNSANNSMSLGQPSSRHLLAPPSQFGHHRLTAQHHSSPLKGEYPYSDNDDGSEVNSNQHFDEYEESSLQNSWVEDTRDQNGIMLLNDKEHQDEQHLLFLQDMANLSHGDSISLFAKLADEELDVDETRDQSRLQLEQISSSYDNPPFRNGTSNNLNNNGRAIGNEIFDKEFRASLMILKTPLVQQPPPPLESSSKRNILDELHTIPTPNFEDQDIRKQPHNGSGQKGGNEAYKQALKSFRDSLMIADPIRTPHKFAPQPLPILWNEPKIRAKGLPSFNLDDYKDKAKATLVTKGTNPLLNAVTNANKRDSYSSSPTTTHSVPNSSQSSPLSSAGASPPSDIKSKVTSTPNAPTGATYKNSSIDNLSNDGDNGAQQQQLKQSILPASMRPKKPTVSNPHLAFDPTVAPSDRVEETKSAKNTLERRSNLQQVVTSKIQQDVSEEEDSGTIRRSITGIGSLGVASGPKGPAVRKRRSLHQAFATFVDMFLQGEDIGNNNNVEQQQHDLLDEEQQMAEPISRRGSRLLPESLTSLNNHAIHQEAERARRLSEENSAKSPITLSLGRLAGTRYTRSGSNASGSTDMSPTTPTTTNPHGTFAGRTPRQSIQRLSVSGASGIFSKPQQPDEAQPLSAQVQGLGLSKLPSPVSTISRSGAQSSPPNPQQGIRRPGYSSQELDFPKSPRMPSPTDYNDDYYRAEENVQPRRGSYQQQQDMDRDVLDWQDEDDLPRRYQSPQQQQSKFRDPPPPLVRTSSSDMQKEQHNLQRLRIQQQAREEVYGRGYGNGYADDQEFVDEFQSRPNRQSGGGQQRAAASSPPRDYFSLTTRSGSGVMRNSPPVQGQTRYTEHYRRPSRDGHSLLPAPRISPPLDAIPTSRAAPINGASNIGTSRRSYSDGRGSIVPSTARRLSNAATVGYGSALPTTSSYSAGGGGGGMASSSLHGRSVSTGSALGNSNQRASLYAPSSGLSTTAGGRGGSVPEMNLPRRPSSSMMQPPSTVRRSSGGYGVTSTVASSGIRGSTYGAPANAPSPLASSDYGRGYVPQRQNTTTATSGINNVYGGVSSYANRSQNPNDHDIYSYKSDLPPRHNTMGQGNVGSLAHRSGIASTPRNGSGGGGMLSYSSSSSLSNIPSASSSHPRRTSSMGVNPPMNGTASLGRNNGLPTASYRQQPPQQQYNQYQQPPMQQYQQRTSIYAGYDGKY